MQIICRIMSPMGKQASNLSGEVICLPCHVSLLLRNSCLRCSAAAPQSLLKLRYRSVLALQGCFVVAACLLVCPLYPTPIRLPSPANLPECLHFLEAIPCSNANIPLSNLCKDDGPVLPSLSLDTNPIIYFQLVLIKSSHRWM